jgi:hypothetical protein
MQKSLGVYAYRFSGLAGWEAQEMPNYLAGAAPEVDSAVGIADEFTLLIKPEFMKRNCQVVWRFAKRIDVEFV